MFILAELDILLDFQIYTGNFYLDWCLQSVNVSRKLKKLFNLVSSVSVERREV